MLNERFLVSNGGRLLSRRPSPEMVTIMGIMPEVVSSSWREVCQYSPKNFIGSLIIALNRKPDAREFSRAGLVLPNTIAVPVEIIREVPVSFYKQGGEIYTPTGMVAEVLYKRACGLRLGVVLRGALAGLFLRPEDTKNPEKGMSVDRIWNDDLALITEPPYTPEDFFEKQKAPDKVWDNFYETYESLIKEAQMQLGRDPFESEIFFNLCRRLSIPVEESAFHYTRRNLPEDEEGFDSLLFQ